MQQKIKVLIIEDDKEDFLLAKSFLKQINSTQYSIDWEPDYCEALTRISQKEHDVYLVDYNLGTFSGVDLVRQCVNSGINRPFIFLTGMDDITIDMEAMNVGATDYLIKARINDDILERTIRYAIQQKSIEEKLKEANTTKDKLFSIISHDLRSPLSTLMSSLDIITQDSGEMDPEMKNRILIELSKTSKTTFNLLENLLSWSRSQIGALTRNPEGFVLYDVVEDIINLFKSQSRLKSIEITNNVMDSVRIWADKQMIHLVLRNLISNAIKFTHELGSIRIGAEVKGEMVEIYVTDNGVGMDDDMKELIRNLNAFKTTAGTNNEGGSGLGLKIAREFVQKNRGDLWFQSKSGEGSTFFFSIPIEKNK